MLDRNEVNTGRQFEIDLAKTFAVLFMIAIHVCEQMTNMEGSVLPTVVEFLGCPPAAGVFMVAMGVGMVYTRHDTPRDFAVRGVKLLIMGYALNFFRETLLVLIGSAFQIENSYEDVSLYSTLMMVDILHFAGVTFLFVALLKKCGAKPWMMLALAVILHGIGELCFDKFTQLPAVVQYPLGLLLFINEETAFPLCSWFIYPAVGICFGALLRHVTDKTAFYRAVGTVGALTLFAVTAGCISEGISVTDFYRTTKYYGQTFLTTLWCMSVVLLCLGVYYALSLRINGGGRAAHIIKYISANVNTIYILQWLLISYSIAVMEIFTIGKPSVLCGIFIAAVICAVCLLLTFVWQRIKKCHFFAA